MRIDSDHELARIYADGTFNSSKATPPFALKGGPYKGGREKRGTAFTDQRRLSAPPFPSTAS